jgi:hypothetical protein
MVTIGENFYKKQELKFIQPQGAQEEGFRPYPTAYVLDSPNP